MGADPEVSRGRSPRPSVVAGWSVEPESPVPRPSDGVGGRGVGVAEAAARSRPCRVLSRLWRSRVLLCAPGQVVPDAGARRPWPGRRAAAARVGVPRETAEAAQERGVGPGWSVSSGASDYPPVRGGAGPARRPGGQADGRRPSRTERRAAFAGRADAAPASVSCCRRRRTHTPQAQRSEAAAARSGLCGLAARPHSAGPGRPAVPWALWRCSRGCGRPQLTPGTFRGSALDVGWARVSLRPLECVRGSDQPPSRAHARVREREGGAARPLSSHSKRPRYRSLAGKASGESRPDPTAGGGPASHWSRDGLSAKGSQARTGDKRSHSRAAQRASAWLTG